jgi:hypothetical protein
LRTNLQIMNSSPRKILGLKPPTCNLYLWSLSAHEVMQLCRQKGSVKKAYVHWDWKGSNTLNILFYSNVATYYAFHFSAETRMHKVSTFARFSRKLVRPTRTSSCIQMNDSDEARWTASTHGDSNNIRRWHVKCRTEI